MKRKDVEIGPTDRFLLPDPSLTLPIPWNLLNSLPDHLVWELLDFLDAASQYNLLHCTARFAFRSDLWKTLCLARFGLKTTETTEKLQKNKRQRAHGLKASIVHGWTGDERWRRTYLNRLKACCVRCTRIVSTCVHHMTRECLCDGCNSLPSMSAISLKQAGLKYLFNPLELQMLEDNSVGSLVRITNPSSSLYVWEKDVVELAKKKYGSLEELQRINGLSKKERSKERGLFTKKFTTVRQKEYKSREKDLSFITTKYSSSSSYWVFRENITKVFQGYIAYGRPKLSMVDELLRKMAKREAKVIEFFKRFPEKHLELLNGYNNPKQLISIYHRMGKREKRFDEIERQVSLYIIKEEVSSLIRMPTSMLIETTAKLLLENPVSSYKDVEGFLRLSRTVGKAFENNVIKLSHEGYPSKMLIELWQRGGGQRMQQKDVRAKVRRMMVDQYFEKHGYREKRIDDKIKDFLEKGYPAQSDVIERHVMRVSRICKGAWSKPLARMCEMEFKTQGRGNVDVPRVAAMWRKYHGEDFGVMTGESLARSIQEYIDKHERVVRAPESVIIVPHR